jgi:hypothetical protein
MSGGECCGVDDRTIAEMAVSMRLLLTAITAGELTCPPASRHRLEGMVVALEAMSARPRTCVAGQSPE